MDKFIGKTLNDRYILTEIIGVGGMAIVYKAFDRVVNRVVAVKILKEEYMSDAQFRRRFSNESKAITMLSQNNIVDVYDVCLEGDLMYLVMEYIDGVTLKEYLDKVKVLEWKEAAFYIKQILKAMSHAHERGIVHRDLKPHNIMLLRDGTIKVTDFGIAKLSKFDTQTITDKAIGSVHYISPEQASGDRTDEKTDIYSVGVMFYEMITGTLPFVADSPVSVALMQVQAQPKLPREINPDIPVGIEEITIKAMMKDPSLRYPSALQMFNDIVSIELDPALKFGYLDLSSIPEEDTDSLVEDDSPTLFVDLNTVTENDYSSDDIENETDQQEDFEEDEEEESKFKAFWLPIICGIGTAILVVALVVLAIVYFPEMKNMVSNSAGVVEKVVVEDYIGKDYDTIVKENATGLKFEKVNVLSKETAGQILSQDPAAGTEVEKGSIITFKVSTGVETVQVPDLSEKYYQDALDELFELGILYKTKFIDSDTVKENFVVRTDPEAFTEIQSDSSITVYISSGPDIVMVDVPDLIKRNESDAVDKLTEKNLKSDKIYEYHDTIPMDCVISQNPEAGTKVEEGTTVEITISLGPKPDENPDDTPQPDNGSNDNTENPDNTIDPDTGNDGSNDNTENPDNTQEPDNSTDGSNDNTENPDNTQEPDDGTGDSSGDTQTGTVPDNENTDQNGEQNTGGEGTTDNTGESNSNQNSNNTNTNDNSNNDSSKV